MIKSLDKLHVILCAVMLAACSSSPKVTNVTNSGDKLIEGIPFRIKTEHTVRVWMLQEDDTYKEVSVSKVIAPDMSRLYAVDVRSDLFASPTLKVTENADNTLKVVNIKSTNDTSQGLDAINGAVTGLAKARSDKAAAKLNASGAIATAEKAVRDAQDAYDGLASTASAETRAAYQRYIQSAKRQANDAYSAAGLPPPYSDL